MSESRLLTRMIAEGGIDGLKPKISVLSLDRIIRAVLYAYIFSLPFSRLLFVERNTFILLIILVTIWCVANRQHFFCRTPIDVPLAAFVAWVGMSVPFSAVPAYSFGELAKLLQQSLIFYWVVYFFRSSNHKIWMILLFLGHLTVISLYGLWQFDPAPTRKYFFIESFLGSEVALTTFLVMVLPLCAAVAVYADGRFFKRFSTSIIPLAIICQLITFSRAGLLALFVEAVTLAGMVRSRLITSLVGIVLAVGVSSAAMLVYIGDQNKLTFMPVKTKLTTYNLVSRWKAWELGFEKVLEHPVFGSGYGKNMFQRVSEADLDYDVEVPMAGGTHNTLIDITVGAGIPAGLMYLWLMWAIGKTGMKQFRTSQDSFDRIWSLALFLMVGGLFVRNSFDHMWVGSLALIFWVIVGIAVKPVQARSF